MKLPARPHRLSVVLLFALLAGGWPASPSHSAEPQRGLSSYRIFWTATRAAGNVPLLSASAPAEVNKASALRTDSTTPEENRPALPLLTASFSPMRERAGCFELKVLASVREVARNKKGKLKVSKRNIGALTPMRPGESQIVSAEGDPIRLEVRVEAVR